MRRLLPTDPALLQRFAAGASLSLATLLALLKLAAAVTTGSLAVLSSLIDSLADIVASAITFVAVQISQQPPDRGHRFGHGKAESLSAMAQAALVAGTAVFVLIDAARRLGDPRAVRSTTLGIAVMTLRHRRDPAPGLRSSATSCAGPARRRSTPTACTTAPTCSPISRSSPRCVVTQRFGWLWLDPLMGAAMALYLGWNAYRIGQDAVKVLMDHELPPETAPADQGHRPGPPGGAGPARPAHARGRRHPVHRAARRARRRR